MHCSNCCLHLSFMAVYEGQPFQFTFLLSLEPELAEASHRQRGHAFPLLHPLPLLWGGQPPVVQQGEELEPLAHLLGVHQHVVALNELGPGGRVWRVPEQNLRRIGAYVA